MDRTFNSAKKVYRDNFLEYKLTNDPKYKIAYEGALQSMKNTITTLKSQTHGTKDIAKKIVKEKDLVRILPEASIIPTNLTTKYIILGVVGIVAFGLLVV